MRRNCGFTITELLIAIAIVVALTAIGFVASRPAIESARRTSCANNMRSIYQALTLYTADWPVPAFGYTDVASPCGGTKTLLTYGLDPANLTCPSATPSMRHARESTYFWFISSFCAPLDEDEQAQRAELVERKKEEFPLVICNVHDILFYEPQERKYAFGTIVPWLIILRADGSVTRGRSDVIPRMPRLP